LKWFDAFHRPLGPDLKVGENNKLSFDSANDECDSPPRMKIISPAVSDKFRTGAKRLLSTVDYRELKAVASLLF
jgi:hypothetical protein